MRKHSIRGYLMVAMTAGLFASGGVGTAYALTSSSPNYQVTESDFGSTSLLENCSGSYCTQVTMGSVEAGESTGTSYNAAFGSLVGQEDPLLEVIIEPGVSNLGVLSTESVATKTVGVKVRNYMSGGYIVQIVGSPPKYGSHTISALASPTASTPGTEQFGFNVANNTTPDIGENPAQVPSGEFSFGAAAPGYDTPNLFKYVSGEVVARSLSESGRTDYTVSMIVNIANSTPAGHYATDFSAIVSAAF